MPKTAEQVAKDGYDAYGADAGWTTWDGKPMLTWAGLPPKTKRHWIAASRAIVRAAVTE